MQNKTSKGYIYISKIIIKASRATIVPVQKILIDR